VLWGIDAPRLRLRSPAGITDPGRLAVGVYADIVVFDAGTSVTRRPSRLPKQLAIGIRHVVVNGAPVLRDGAPTSARPGRGIRLETPRARD
jgi:N-acyl-D-amino-acid deacylase